MQLTLTISNDGIDEYELGFKIQKPTKIEDAFVRVQLLNYDEFNRFSDDYKNITTKKDLTEVIFIYQTRPISSVNQKEPYFNAAQVKRKILRGSSQEALRNKLILKRDMISRSLAKVNLRASNSPFQQLNSFLDQSVSVYFYSVLLISENV